MIGPRREAANGSWLGVLTADYQYPDVSNGYVRVRAFADESMGSLLANFDLTVEDARELAGDLLTAATEAEEERH